MKFVIEFGRYPNVIREEVVECASESDVIALAKERGADYVWSAPEDANPNSVYKGPR